MLKRTAVPSRNLPLSSAESIDNELKLAMETFSNELNVEIIYYSETESFSQIEVAKDNKLAEKIKEPFKRQPLSVLEVSSGGEVNTNDEFILGL